MQIQAAKYYCAYICELFCQAKIALDKLCILVYNVFRNGSIYPLHTGNIRLNGGINMAVLTITKENFKTEVVESSKPVLLDFWASWCAPCMMQSPIVDSLAENHPEIKVGKVNVDEQPELASAFAVESIPTLVVIKDGITKEILVGLHREEQILEQFK